MRDITLTRKNKFRSDIVSGNNCRTKLKAGEAIKRLTLALIFLICTSLGMAQTQYMTFLIQNFQPRAMNDQGLMVGAIGPLGVVTNGQQFWTYAFSGQNSCVVTDINESGAICGFYTDAISGRIFSFYNSFYGTDTGLRFLPNPGTSVQASCLNDNGMVTGRAISGISSTQAFKWTPGSASLTQLTTGSALFDAGGQDINNSGVAVGYYIPNTGTGLPIHERTYQWTSAPGAGYMFGPGNSSAASTGINNLGQIAAAGGAGANGKKEVMRYSSGSWTRYGNLGGEFTSTFRIAESGEVLGKSQTPAGIDHAVMARDGILYDLNDWSNASDYGLTITEVRDMDSYGWIIGSATNGVNQYGVVLVPMDPVPPLTVGATPTYFPWFGSSTGKVTLGSPAPAGGAVVSLSTSSSRGVVPSTVTVPQGEIEATFDINSSLFDPDIAWNFKVIARYNGEESQVTMAVLPSILTQLHLHWNPVHYNGTAVIVIRTSCPAPLGGWSVGLSSSNPSLLNLPATATIPEGMSYTVVTVDTGSGSGATTVDITATLRERSLTSTLSFYP